MRFRVSGFRFSCPRHWISVLRKMTIVLVALVLARPYAGMGQGIERFRADLEALTANPHRLAGREDGSRSAAAYVERRLNEMGVEEIYIQEFPVVQPRATECRIETEGQSYPILAMRPNLLQASVTPAEGIEGRTLYAGRGTPADYGEESLEGRIVVLDFDCADNWVQAFAFGARAVLFLGPGSGDARAGHHLNFPANLPRFYVPEKLADMLALKDRPREVRLLAAAAWEELQGRNVIAVIRGTGASFREERPDEAVILAAPLDSLSEVPERSPGARDAANCAALLALAQHLSVSPAKRDVILAFFDGQAQNHLGARAFYGGCFRRLNRIEIGRQTLEERLAMFEEEQLHIEAVNEVLAHEDLFSPECVAMDRHADALRMMRGHVIRLRDRTAQQLGYLRNEISKLQQELKKGAEDAGTEEALRGEIARLETDSARLGEIDRLAVEDLCWNSILRSISEKTPLGDDESLRERARDLIPGERDGAGEMMREYFAAHLRDSLRFAKERTIKFCGIRLSELAISKTQTMQSKALRDAVGPERNGIVLHLSLNLGDARGGWSLIHGDDSPFPTDADFEGLYAGLFKTVRDMRAGLGDSVAGFDSRPVSGIRSSRLFAPGLFVDSGAIAREFRIFNVSAMTVLDALPRQGLPTDTLDALDTDTVFSQAAQAATMLAALADHEDLSRDYPDQRACRLVFDEYRWSRLKTGGHSVRQSDVGDPMRTATVPFAVVAAVPRSTVAAGVWEQGDTRSLPPGFVWTVRAMTRSDGIFEMGPVFGRNFLVYDQCFAATFDGESGPGVEPAARGRGLIANATVESDWAEADDNSEEIARVRMKTIVGYGYERLTPTIAMRAASTARFRSDRHLLCELENVLTLFAPYDAHATKLFNPYGMTLLRNSPTKKLYQGIGVPVDNAFDFPLTARENAHDLHVLNEYRLNLLRENRIGQESLEVLHGQAGDIADDVSADGGTAARRHGMLESSAAISRRVYKPLVGVMNDLVTAVAFLLILSLPFAFALERLLIGTPHIYRQIGWFAVFFLATFGVLYMVNPAFKLAATPVIIFLAFTIILLSSIVIFIMFRKLQAELSRIEGLGVSAHSADVSRLSTMAAAVKMGISTMRRRPLRTLLTSVTIILLTFTILTFASFGSSWGNRRMHMGMLGDMTPRILVRNPFWGRIGEGLPGTLSGYLAGRADVVPRYWLAPLNEDVAQARLKRAGLEMLLADQAASNTVPVAAAMGLDRRDLLHQQPLRECFSAGARIELLESDGIFMTGALADALGLTDQDIGAAKLLLQGRALTFGGLLSDKLALRTMVDGSSVLPVDYEATGAGEALQMGDQTKATAADADSTSFTSFNLNSVVVLASPAAEMLGGHVRAICIYPDREDDIEAIAGDIATIAALPTYAGTRNGVYRLFFSTLVAASGFRDLIIPIALGGLIVFGTMLGSVADREREIYSFSSLGLAPAHVAGLFFAEASIYAVIGGMGGYLLGQVATRLLGLLSGLGWFSVPSMNFSSTNAIATIFIVMAVVLLSTLYPAIKASRSANPGIQRAWKLPAPVGDLYDVAFPFTVSEYDLTGIATFLEEHFGNFRDTAIGIFTTLECDLFRIEDSRMPAVSAYVALSPFDLGIEQRFVLLSRPSDVEGINEVRVLMHRVSGTYGDWTRATRVFVNDLRKQFLIWRALDEEVTERYREKTLERWETLKSRSESDVLSEFGAATEGQGA